LVNRQPEFVATDLGFSAYQLVGLALDEASTPTVRARDSTRVGMLYAPSGLPHSLHGWRACLAGIRVASITDILEDHTLTVPQRAAVINISLLLLTVSVAMNAVGATPVAAAISWNSTPSIDANPQRLWDWEHPQFLAWAQHDS
jgi:hypothetical protein